MIKESCEFMSEYLRVSHHPGIFYGSRHHGRLNIMVYGLLIPLEHMAYHAHT